jgi:hypothetical protein
MYGKGERGVVLAHGDHSNKDSWASRLERSKAQDFTFWRSTSGATDSRADQANLILILLRYTSTWSLP